MDSTKIQYFQGQMNEIKKAQQNVMMLTGKYNEEFGGWLKEQGVPENVALIDLIAHFAPKTPSIIT